MKAFIACVKTDGTKVAKYQDFDTEADAQTHVSTYGGFVAAAPSGTVPFWIADAATKTLTHDSAAEQADVANQKARKIQSSRLAAYQAEADPLFFEEQRGEVPEGTHASKVAEIKARFPK